MCYNRNVVMNVKVFKNWIEEKFRILNQKVMLICGDFNIDLLNTKLQKNLLIPCTVYVCILK